MARPSKPWYWRARDAWFVNIKGKRHLLAKGKGNRANAYREYLRIADRHNPEVATAGSAAAICQLFMTYARANLKPNTVNGHTQYAVAFCESVHDMDANSVQPKHVSDFLNAHPNWNSTSRYSAIKSIKRVWAWALAEGHITVNQLKPMKRPRPQQRDTIPDD